MTPTFWSCLTKDVPGVSTSMYDDAVESRYAYDSNVPHSQQIAVGDVLVIRDPYQVRGYGVVESIDVGPAVKMVSRCPRCDRAKVSVPRQPPRLRFRCASCGHQFDEAHVVPMPVTAYIARYGSTWAALGAVAPTDALARDSVYAAGDQQNAIRRLDTEAAWAFLHAYADTTSALNLGILVQTGVLPGGHLDALVRVRRGQAQFRDALFERFGSVCAVTGDQPADVLDAAHLYSFAQRPEHHRDGGLLLRSDVHRLFDRLLITFDPTSWNSEVAPVLLRSYPRLEALHGQPIAVAGSALPDRALIADHRAAARKRWAALERQVS